jgi:hypothetical protein
LVFAWLGTLHGKSLLAAHVRSSLLLKCCQQLRDFLQNQTWVPQMPLQPLPNTTEQSIDDSFGVFLNENAEPQGGRRELRNETFRQDNEELKRPEMQRTPHLAESPTAHGSL